MLKKASAFISSLLVANGKGLEGRLLGGISWGFLGLAATRAFSVVGFILLARGLGRVDFGVVSMIRSTVFMFGVAAGVGLPEAMSRFPAKFHERSPVTAWQYAGAGVILQAVLAFIAFAIVWISAPKLAGDALSSPELTSVIRLGGLLLVAASANETIRGISKGFQKFGLTALNDTIQGAGLLVFGAVGAFLYGVTGTIIGLTVSHLVALVVGFYFLWRQCGGSLKPRDCIPTGSQVQELAKFSFPVALSSLLSAPVSWFANALLFRAPNGASEMGAFRAGEQFRNTILYLPNLLSGVLLPVLAASGREEEREKSRKILALSMVLVSFVGGVSAVIFSALSGPIMLLYGDEFREIEVVLAAVFFTGAFAGAPNVLYMGLLSTGKAWASFWITLIQSFVLLVAAYFLIPNHGAVGFALAFILCHVAKSLAILSFFSDSFLTVMTLFSTAGLVIALAGSLYLADQPNLTIYARIGGACTLVLIQAFCVPAWARSILIARIRRRTDSKGRAS